MDRASNAEIRAMVISAMVMVATIPGFPVLVRGDNWLRYGRWVISNTTTTGIYVVCKIAKDAKSCAAYRGTIGKLRHLVSQEMRDAWQAEQYGERDDD